MKAIVLTGIQKFEIKQLPMPQIKNDTDVLIKVKMAGVCGSDIHYYKDGRIGSQIVEFPFVIGHEGAGIVEKTGKGVSKVKPGQRIAIEPTVFCGKCDQCKAGRENTCRNLLFLGCPKQLDGCLSEYIVMPENCCFPIKDSMSFEQATVAEPLAIAVYSVERTVLSPGASVAILGIGPIGMSIFHVLRTRNAGNIYVTDKIKERLELSQKLKPKWAGNPDTTDIVKEITKQEPLLLEVVFECCGQMDAILQAIQLLKPGGTLVLVGIPEFDDIVLPIHELRRREISILNIRRQANCTQKAIDLIDQGFVNIDSMVTHHFPIEKTKEAFDLVSQYKDGVMKAMISMD